MGASGNVTRGVKDAAPYNGWVEDPGDCHGGGQQGKIKEKSE